MPLGHLGGAHIFRGEFPRFSCRFDLPHQSLLWTFPLAPPSPPLPPPGPRTHCRQIPGTQAPPAGGVQGATRPICGLPLAPLAPPAPPWPPLAPGPPWPAPPGPPWPSLPGPLLSLPFSAKETSACLAAKAEVGIEGASPKP